jgi:hypothetical protein
MAAPALKKEGVDGRVKHGHDGGGGLLAMIVAIGY